jgi:hypothetical protein
VNCLGGAYILKAEIRDIRVTTVLIKAIGLEATKVIAIYQK